MYISALILHKKMSKIQTLQAYESVAVLTYVSDKQSLSLERYNHQTTVYVVRTVDEQIRQNDRSLAVQLFEIHPGQKDTYDVVMWNNKLYDFAVDNAKRTKIPSTVYHNKFLFPTIPVKLNETKKKELYEFWIFPKCRKAIAYI